MSSPNRQPAGIPAGGQFAAGTLDRAAITLDPQPNLHARNTAADWRPLNPMVDTLDTPDGDRLTVAAPDPSDPSGAWRWQCRDNQAGTFYAEGKAVDRQQARAAAQAAHDAQLETYPDLDAALRERFGDDAPAVREALGDGAALSTEDLNALAVLLNPANDPWESAESIEDQLNEYETFSGWDVDEARRVAECLIADRDRQAGDEWHTSNLSFSLSRDSDGVVSSYSVDYYLGHETGLYLSDNQDVKYLGSEVGGLRGALAAATNLAGDFDRLVAKARQMGLYHGPQTDQAA